MARSKAGGEPFLVVDLFAGPGGLGDGFAAVKRKDYPSQYAFRTAIAIEKDKHAYETLKLRNFFRAFKPGKVPSMYYKYLVGKVSRKELYRDHPNEHEIAHRSVLYCELKKNRDVNKTIAKKIAGCNKWVLVGGPPCQSYSLVGRSRMRKQQGFEEDPRNDLYMQYVKAVAKLKPPVFILENVRGILTARHKKKEVFSKLINCLKTPEKALRSKYTGLSYKLHSLSGKGVLGEEGGHSNFLLNTADYGIPQARNRIFVLGIRSDINIKPGTLQKQEGVSIDDVIGDLPVIRSGLSKQDDSFDAWRKIIADTVILLKNDRTQTGIGDVVRKAEQVATELRKRKSVLEKNRRIRKKEIKSDLRHWYYDIKLKKELTCYEARSHIASDIQRYFFSACFADVRGVSPKLGDYPVELLPQHQNVQHMAENTIFSDRFRVQIKKRQATTITSHISKDGHYYIHYDPKQCRSLTVREAARLQTFPDNYKFEGPRTFQYQQIGNAVPPLFAYRIAEEVVYDILDRIKD